MADDFNPLTRRFEDFFRAAVPARIGVAISGGSDSTALLMALHDWQLKGGPAILAATVDHGLRPTAAEEARQVAKLCAGIGLHHDTLRWQGWDGSGNLQDAARRARYRLLAAWARDKGLDHVALGHTADDQAETFLMRLSRKAGVDGLSAMSGRRRHDGVEFVRPLLGTTRAELRGYLENRNVTWIDDPSNEERRFERVRMRQLLELLGPLGLSVEAISAVTQHLGAARNALDQVAQEAATQIVRVTYADLVIDREGFGALNPELSRRILSQALRWISAADYAPRGQALDQVSEALGNGVGMTLHGARILPGSSEIRITRELAACPTTPFEVNHVWDRRWRITAPMGEVPDPGLEVGPLTLVGLGECADWRDAGLPGPAMAATPAIRRNGTLIAAPVAGHGLADGWRATPLRGLEDYLNQFAIH